MENCEISDKLSPIAAMFPTDQIYFSYFGRGAPGNYFYQIISNSDNVFQRRRHLSHDM